MENIFTVKRLQRWAFRMDLHPVRWGEDEESPAVGHAVSLAVGPWLFIWARFLP